MMSWLPFNAAPGVFTRGESKASAMLAGAPCIATLLLLVAGPVAASAQPTTSQRTTHLFWDRYLAARPLLDALPDSALTTAERWIEADAESFLGSWLRGAWAARWDSVRATAAVRLVSAPGPRGPGLQVEAGTILLARGRVDEGRSALERARDEYLARGRCSDAARAVLWKAVRSGGRDPRAPSDAVEAESLARRCDDPATLGDVLVEGGEIVARAGHDMRRAERMFREAVALLEPIGNCAQLVHAHHNAARSLMEIGVFDSAATGFQRAISLARDLGDARQEGRSITGLGYVRQGQGRYPEGVALLERALEISHTHQDTTYITTGLHELGAFLLEMGRLKESRDRLEECLRVTRASRRPLIEASAMALHVLGNVESALGEFEPARRHLEQALVECRKQEELHRWVMPEFMLDLARLERRLGDFDRARALIDEGLRGARQARRAPIEVELLNERAALLFALGEPGQALTTAREAKRRAREVGPRFLWRVGQTEAAALARLGRLRDAMVVLDSTVSLLEASPDSTELMRALLLQGALHLRAGEAGHAARLCERSLAVARALANPALIADARLTLGAAQVVAGRVPEGVRTLELGLEWFEGVQSAVRASEERGAYQAQWYDAYVWLARAYARLGRTTSALATLERSRAREARRLARAARRSESRVPARLASEIETVESALDEAQSTLLYAYGLPAGRRPRNLAVAEAQVDSLRGARAALGRRLQREAPAFARETGEAPPIVVADLRRRMSPGERLIAYMIGADASLLFDVGPERLSVHELPWSEDSLVQRVRRALERVRAGRMGDDGEWFALSDGLLGPYRLGERPPHRIYVLPDGPLHHLPFEALRAPGPAGEHHYLVEHSEVVYGMSATLLFQPTGATAPMRAADRAPLVAFGDPSAGPSLETTARLESRGGALPALTPLPFARREVLELSRLFPGARTYLGDQATESRFLDELASATIVHVAAHAFVDDRRPEFSGIALAPTPGRGGRAAPDDGLVQAFEVMERSVNVELATLSACETGGGKLLRGEGLLGLARAFRLAGARNLVVSLWKVDDAATSEFMGEFYARLSRGASPAAALRDAKITSIGRARRAPAAAGAGGAGESRAVEARIDEDPDQPHQSDSLATSDRGVGTWRTGSFRAQPATWAAFVLLGSKP